MGLLQTLWMKRIMENIYADNAFIEKSQNWDEYATNGAKTVVIPQAGLAAGFERNRTVRPAVAVEAPDSDVEYVMTNYTSNPVLVTNLDQLQMSYDKMQSKVVNMTSELKEGMAVDLLYAWRPEAANILQTTGGDTESGLVGSTGNRKRLTFADCVKAGKFMNKKNIPKLGRILLVTSDMHADLLLDPDVKDKFNTTLANLNTGVLGTLAGFTVMERSSTLACTSANAVKVPSAAIAATDSEMAIAWHPQFVGRSLSGIQTYYEENSPLYYGNIISMEANLGGKKAYADGRGVVGIKAAISA